ncbi:hypothetical protein CyaNS01_02743 [Cyanobium sp. NS01]|nr:hypothetical protein CyaNS01_02743 [Cyanobium sp. NS01]
MASWALITPNGRGVPNGSMVDGVSAMGLFLHRCLPSR